MAGGAFITKQVMAGVAAGIAVVVAFVGAWILYSDNEDDGAVASVAQIIVSGPIDAIDSEASFHPPVLRVLLGENSTVTWVNRNGTSLALQSTQGLFDAEIPSGGSFSFAFVRPGIYGYLVIESGKTGTVVVSTADAEENRLTPVSLSKGAEPCDDVYRHIAATIAAAANPQDKVNEIRLNNTRVAAYVTQGGADIRVPKSMCDTCVQADRYDAVDYRSEGGSPVLPSAESSETAAMNFSRQFLERIGYELDGTEWVDVVDFGDRVEIKFSQQADKWIIPNHFVRFNFYHDHISITVTKWYNDISSYRFGLSQYDAVPIAREFMDSEVANTPALLKYGYGDGSAEPNARVEIFDDKVVYVVDVGYKTTNPKYVDERDHCGSPSVEGFDVLVDSSSGSALGWRYSICE